MADLSGGAKCIKYTLFVFNLLFLLGGLALIIVGAVVQVQSNQSYGGSSVSAGGIFIIIVGAVIFLVSFFGCAGAINNNYCMVVTYGVLLLLLLLAEIAAVITGFYMKNQIEQTITNGMNLDIRKYNVNHTTNDITTQWWDKTQQELKCCGSSNYTSWNLNGALNGTHSVPDSCCVRNSTGCGIGATLQPPPFILNDTIYTTGCVPKTVTYLQTYLIAVGAVAAAVALLELLGIIFAFCLAHSLRKDYRVV